MAKKIDVYEPHSDRPSHQLPKNVALLQIRRLLADWVEYGVSIRRRTIRQITPGTLLSYRAELTPKSYIPAKLPSAEVPGVHFQLPQSPTWRRQHRLTVLGLEFVEKYPVEVQI